MSKNKSFLLLVLAMFSVVSASYAQILEPVKWSFSLKMLEKNSAQVIAKCTIEEKWHVYALVVSPNPDAMAIPTSFEFEASPRYELVGKPKEGKFITHYDPTFEMDLNYFENTATFTQEIKYSGDTPFILEGGVNFMACDDQKCIPPGLAEFKLKITPNPVNDSSTGETTPDSVESEPVNISSDDGIEDPVKWSFTSSKNAAGEYEIEMTADMQKGWHIYAQKLEGNEGPVPTSFKFISQPGVELKETVQEGTPIVKYDPNFMMNLSFFDGKATFIQKLVLATDKLPKVEGVLNYMACNDEGCRPPKDVKFIIDLATGKGYEKGIDGDASTSDAFVMPGVDLENPHSDCGMVESDKGLWAIFIFGILGGLLALFTPCVFPMIPLTVSFFTKGSEGGKGKRRAVTYGFFILLIYFLLSLPFHLSKNVDPAVLNGIATNTWLNIAFFSIFVVFAISFFGFFEITLPSGLANRADKASNIGGLIGIFFMALTLAIVSFSCTGPILGSVIGSIYASDELGLVNILGMELSYPASKVTAAMLGFGLALGAPFAVFAAFPGMLKRLPKSGGWLQDFKVSLGFLELAFALKFLSNSDLVEQWGLIKRELFFGIWILIGLFWVLYLMGVFTFKKGYNSTTKMKGMKLVFVILIAAFTIRLVPGVFPQSELNRFDFLSGFPPPKFYSFYDYEAEFKIYTDLEEGMAAAREQNKPVFLDFTGWACVNCRKMEDTVWPEDLVKPLLANEFVMVSLYVDEKIELPDDQQFIYLTRDGRKKEIKTVGHKWETLQTETFNNNSQPMYAILSPNGQLLTPPRKFDANVKKYADWLSCGLHAFEELEGPTNTAMK